jgi:ataxia telangiectasia mutated family protein
VERIWTEYAKRGEAFRLQLADISFSLPTVPADYLRNDSFSLRPHDVEGESYWAIVQNLAFLESILLKYKPKKLDQSEGNGEQPRKKRRVQETDNRIRVKLMANEAGIRRTALQLIPFILTSNNTSSEDVGRLLQELVTLAAHKDPVTSSWALVACASYLSRHNALVEQADAYRQLWHLATRSVSLPATSRAACVLLHTMLRADVLPYHSISQEVNSMVTTADVNGPAVLSDTSLSLMLYILHLRNARLPSASQATRNHIIRWVFMKWNPSQYTLVTLGWIRPNS